MKTIQKRIAAIIKSSLSERLCRLLILVATIYSLFILNASVLTAGTATLSWSPPVTNADGSQITNLAGYKIYYGTTSGSYSQSVDAGNVTTYTFASLVDGNTYYFSATAYNSSGSESTFSNEVSKSLPPGVDIVPPVGTIAINSGATYAASVSATLNISATDSSGVSQMCISNTATCSAWEAYATSKAWTLSSGPGITTVSIWFKDSVGNINSTPYSDSITLDTTAPTGSIIINGGAVSTNTSAVSLTLSANDANGVSQMQFSNDNITWSSAGAYAATKAWTMTASDGTKTVYVKFKDNAENWSAVFTDTISLDTATPVTTASPVAGLYSSAQNITLTANKAATIYYTVNGSTPTITSPVYSTPVSLTGSTTLKYFARDGVGNSETVKTSVYTIDTTGPTGSININAGAASANNTSATLTLSATDANSVSQMQFSNDNVIWSAAEAYATTKAWTLTAGDGTKTVYVKFKDNAGNWSQVYSDTISLSQGAPTTTASPAGGTFKSAQTVALTANKAGTIYFTTNGSVPTTSSPVYTAPVTISATTALKFFAVDTIGNSESIKTETYTIDTTLPAFSSTAPIPGSFVNTSVVGYTLSETVSSGKITFVRTGGALDSATHVYNFTNADKTIGTHNVNTGISLTNGTQYTVSFDATDLAGNPAATVSNKSITYDHTGASLSINGPASNSIVNHNDVTYNLSENISSGKILFTWTGGNPDNLSPHNYILGPGERTAGSHTVNTGFLLINGAIYSVELKNVIDMAGNQASSVSNTNITYDSSSLTITNISPQESAIITDPAVRYNLNKAAVSAKITFTRTGGEPDSKSPHVYIPVASDLYPGDHTIDTKLNLVDGAFYTVSFEAKDMAGNPATTVSNAMLFYDSSYINTPIGNVDNAGRSKLRVDGSDLIKLSIAFGSSPGEPAWNPVCDLNKSGSSNGIIDGNDLITFGAHFGEVSK